MTVCEDGALSLTTVNPEDLVVPDPNAAKYAEQRAAVRKAKEEGRAKLKGLMDTLEQLVDTSEE